MAFGIEIQKHSKALRGKEIELAEVEYDRMAAVESTARVVRELVKVGGIELTGDSDYGHACLHFRIPKRAMRRAESMTSRRTIHVVSNSH
ncbi:MAG: hypothetical protein QOH60_485 [Mycobacterium sp.]|jgi:hypothetical protein|nr:hypothetical protein [Mycobacterium sp.]